MEIEKLFDGTNLPREEMRKRIELACDKLKKILLMKNEEYNYASFKTGIISNYARLQDKVNRYESLLKKMTKDEKPQFESLHDTLLDTAGYGIIGSILVDELERQKK